MSNNQNFILQNPVFIKGASKAAQGVISSNSIDLSTGNSFSVSLTDDTTFTFANPSDVQFFRVDVSGGLSGDPYDIVNTSLVGSYQLPTSLDNYGVTIKPDGSKIYIADITGDQVYQYSMSPAYDVTSMQLEATSANFGSAYNVGPTHYAFNANGTKMFACGNARIQEYALSTAWYVNTATLTTTTSTQTAYSMKFNNDGTKLYYNNAVGDRIYEYDLSTAYDLSTMASQANGYYDYGSYSDAWHFDISNDGTSFYLMGDASSTVRKFTMSTAYDITTASYASVEKSLSFSDPRGICFSSDGKYMYILDRGADILYQYYFGSPISITWPTVAWSDGQAPSSPPLGKTSSYSFVTDDGGTTYHGYGIGLDIS